jgi:cold shock CspA family protein
VNNNAGPWNMFEDFYRAQVRDANQVAHVYAGGIFGKSPVQARGVAVPSFTWKIVALTDAGAPASQITERTRVVAIKVPNENDTVKVEHDWGRYRVSVAELERETGLTFFSELPPQIASVIKNRVDTGAVPVAEKHDWKPHNYGDNGQSQLKAMVGKQMSGRVKWYDSDKKYGFITLADGKDVYVNAANRLTSIARGEAVTLDVGLDQAGRTFAMQVRSLSPNATPENVKR